MRSIPEHSGCRLVLNVLKLNSLYVKSISVALQALVVISMGGIADHRMFDFTSSDRSVSLPCTSAASKEDSTHLRLFRRRRHDAFPGVTIHVTCMAPMCSARNYGQHWVRRVHRRIELVPTNASTGG